jgi:hypothetical protein
MQIQVRGHTIDKQVLLLWHILHPQYNEGGFCQILRSDLEAKPVVRGEGNDGITEMQKRLERKADVDTVEQLLRGSTKTKEVISASFHVWLDMSVLGGAIQM